MKETEHSVKVWLKMCMCCIYSNHMITSNSSDIDECESVSLNNCDENADCLDTEGSFTCTCREGYAGSGVDCQGKCCTI